MSWREYRVPLLEGDVASLLIRRVGRGNGFTVYLSVFDHGASEPLIQAKLRRSELRAFVRAVQNRNTRRRW